MIDILGLSVLLLAVDVWLVLDCVSLLVVESVSVSVSSVNLLGFCGSLFDSLDSLELDSVGAGESGLDSGMVSVFSNSLASVVAEWPFMAMCWVNRLIISSGEYDGLGMLGLLCTMVDGLVRTAVILVLGCRFTKVS